MTIGVAGLGGYAFHVSEHLMTQSSAGGSGLLLTAACDPDVDAHADRAAELRSTGVTVVHNFDQMFSLPIYAVWLPMPIALHRPYLERALAAGKAVLVEKPAAATIEEVDAMIAARAGGSRENLKSFPIAPHRRATVAACL